MSKPSTLNEVVGRNVRRLRLDSGLTLDQVSKRARMCGLKWSTARVVELEKGRLPVTLQVMMILCWILSEKAAGRLALSDLLDGAEGSIFVTESTSLPAELIRSALQGGAVDFGASTDIDQRRVDEALRTSASGHFADAADVPDGVSLHAVNVALEGITLSDERAAKRLQLSIEAFAAHCARLWGQSMSARRDNIAWSEAFDQRASETGWAPSPQRLGQITRELERQLRDAVEQKNGRGLSLLGEQQVERVSGKPAETSETSNALGFDLIEPEKLDSEGWRFNHDIPDEVLKSFLDAVTADA